MKEACRSAGNTKVCQPIPIRKLYTLLLQCKIKEANLMRVRFLFIRVQKKSRLHGYELEKNFALYDVFEEGFGICINNPVSAKFLYNVTSSVKGIAHIQLKLPRHTQCRVHKLWLVLIHKRGRFMMKIWLLGEGWVFFWTLLFI